MATGSVLGLPRVKRTMLVAQTSGRLYQVDFTEDPAGDDPILVDWDVSVSKMLLGKFQLTRTRAITLEEIEIENVTHPGQFPVGSESDMEVTLYNSLDGKNVSNPIPVIVAIDEGGLVKCVTRTTGQNFSMQLRGTYNVNTIVFTTHNNGRR